MGFISNQSYRNIFISWFISIPFGASCLSFSIGFMTIYPALIFMLGIFAISLSKIKFDWKKKELLILAILALPLIYSLIRFPFVEGKSDAIIDIRSWGLQWLTIANFVMGYKIMATDRFNDVLRIGVRIFLGILLFFGIFEMLTGIHFSGKYTEKLWNLQAGNWTYAPIFTFDNPNNYLAYIFILSILLLWLDERFRKSKGAIFALFILIYFISFMGDVRFGKFLSLAVCLAVIVMNFYDWRKFLNSYRYGIVFAAGMLIVLIASNPLYFGPMWKDGNHYRIQNIIIVKDSLNKPYVITSQNFIKKYGEKSIYQAVNHYDYIQSGLGSFQLRKNLIFNGIYLFKKSYFLGVGPGQFRYLNRGDKLPNETGTLDSPHNYFIELISQLGLIGLVIPIFLIITCFKFARDKSKSYYFRFWFVFGIGLFGIASNLPSSFLILDINWIFIATVAVLYLQINPQEVELGKSGEKEV